MISLSTLTFMRLLMLYSDIPVRLTGHNTTYAGRVEVFSNGIWGRVCSYYNSWREKEAAVVCRQLGFSGVVTALSYSAFGEGSGPVVMSGVQCLGTEKTLQQCQYEDMVNSIAYKGYEVGVVCKIHDFHRFDSDIRIRLQGSSVPNAGRVEVLHAGIWGAISARNWDTNSANVVCRQLGYQAGAEAALKNSVFGPFFGPVWLSNLQCAGSEINVMDCPHDGIGNQTEKLRSSGIASVVCRDGTMSTELKVRLRGSHLPNVGRVEVHFAGVWGCIYPWGWNDKNAVTVICRQLGYAGSSLSGESSMFRSEETVGPWFTDLHCNGSETTLNQCGREFCPHFSDTCLSVLCTNATADSGYELRLRGSLTSHAGRVEIKTHGIWGSISSPYFSGQVTSETIRVICRQLGFNDGILWTGWSGRKSEVSPQWFNSYHINCLGNESNIMDCISNAQPRLRPSYYRADLGVICKPNVSQIKDFQVRLTGSSLPFAGTIEVSYYGVWGGVFGYNIYRDFHVGNVICRQLGYSGAKHMFRRPVFGQVKGALLKEQISCYGNESEISQCTWMDRSGRYYYISTDYTGAVLCAETHDGVSKDFYVRLAGSSISNAGRVEVSYAGVWGTIYGNNWDITNADVVCRQLGYPGAISSGQSNQFGVDTSTVWFRNVRCLGNESSFHECSKSVAGYLRNSYLATAACKLPDASGAPQHCSSLKCASNGICVNTVAGAVCNCTDGFTGLHCEIPTFNPCNSSPCQNGGHCSTNVSSYLCICAEGFAGKRCEEKVETAVNPCLSHPCANDTSCYHNETHYFCLPVKEESRASIHVTSVPPEGEADTLIYIIAILTSLVAVLVAAVVFLILKIRRVTTKKASRPSDPTAAFCNNAFRATVNELDEAQLGNLSTDTDLGLGCVNRYDEEYENVFEASSRPLPPIPPAVSGKCGLDGNSHVQETEPQCHYMGLSRRGENSTAASVTEPACYMSLSSRRPEPGLNSGLTSNGAKALAPKPKVKDGKKRKGHEYVNTQ